MGQGFIFSSKRLWFLFLKNKGWGFRVNKLALSSEISLPPVRFLVSF